MKEEEVAPQDEKAATPDRTTASPHGHEELEAHKAKPKKFDAAESKNQAVTARKAIRGVRPPANNPKTKRTTE